MFLDIVYTLVKTFYRPTIPSMVPIFLAPLATSYHPVLQGSPHLVDSLGVVLCWSGVVLIAGSSVSLELVLWIFFTLLIFSCKLLVFIRACSVCI